MIDKKSYSFIDKVILRITTPSAMSIFGVAYVLLPIFNILRSIFLLRLNWLILLIFCFFILVLVLLFQKSPYILHRFSKFFLKIFLIYFLVIFFLWLLFDITVMSSIKMTPSFIVFILNTIKRSPLEFLFYTCVTLFLFFILGWLSYIQLAFDFLKQIVNSLLKILKKN